ncbi:hypothetical protein ACFQU7_00815 [Pseudoroseomonas wenyumeiae]
MLAPLHRRAAMRRAQQAAGLRGALPTIDELRTAERPPEPIYRITRSATPPVPTPAAVEAETRKVIADVGWRAAQALMPVQELQRLARMEAEDRLAAARQAGPEVRRGS